MSVADAGVAAAYERALALHRSGHLDEAAGLYQQVLVDVPAHCGALHLLGVVQGQRCRFADALDLIGRAVHLDPGVAAAHAHLGNAQHALHRFEDALASYERALALQPRYWLALMGRGKTLQSLSRPSDALASYDAALDVQPECAEALMNRGDILLTMHRTSDGAASLRRAMECGADPERIRFALASIGREPIPGAAPAAYVRDLFDDYAERFDADLIGLLRYRVPELLSDAVLRDSPQGSIDILDLGCGTGLCGTRLKAIARRLTGVDLSPGMLDKARERDVYTELECAELTQYLAGHEEFDLVVAGDVLIYLGDLAPVFAGVKRVLRFDGRFVFSVEAANEGDVELGATRRYRHSRVYLEGLAAAYGFEVDAIEDHVLRLEGGNPVGGYLVRLRLPA